MRRRKEIVAGCLTTLHQLTYTAAAAAVLMRKTTACGFTPVPSEKPCSQHAPWREEEGRSTLHGQQALSAQQPPEPPWNRGTRGGDRIVGLSGRAGIKKQTKTKPLKIAEVGNPVLLTGPRKADANKAESCPCLQLLELRAPVCHPHSSTSTTYTLTNSVSYRTKLCSRFFCLIIPVRSYK